MQKINALDRVRTILALGIGWYSQILDSIVTGWRFCCDTQYDTDQTAVSSAPSTW